VAITGEITQLNS